MQVIMSNLICRRHFHTHLHMSVLQDNCQTLWSPWNIFCPQVVCVCKWKCIHVFMCKCVCMHVWNHMWIAVWLFGVCKTVCVCMCVCVHVWLSCMNLQLSSSAVMGSSGSLRLPRSACVYVWPSWHPRASLVLQLAHSCTHQQSGLFLKSPANQHSFPCCSVGQNKSCHQLRSKQSKPDQTWNTFEKELVDFLKGYHYNPPSYLPLGINLGRVTINQHFIRRITFLQSIISASLLCNHSFPQPVTQWLFHMHTNSHSK